MIMKKSRCRGRLFSSTRIALPFIQGELSVSAPAMGHHLKKPEKEVIYIACLLISVL